MHPHVNAYVLLPWLLLAADRVLARAGPRDVAALAAATGLAWLGGQPESALMVSAAAVAWIACRRPGLRAALLCAGGLALGVALAAVMLLPLHEALGQSGGSDRSGAPLPLRVLGALAVPEYWGRPDRADAAGPVNFTERTLYAGALPLLLAVAGLFARRPRGPQLFFAGLTVVALALAVDTGPVVDLAARLPLLDRINLGRMLSLAAFGLAMLAAFGLQRLLDGDAAERRRIAIAAAVLAALPLLAVFVAHPGWIADAGDGANRLLGRGTPTGDAIAQAATLRWLVAAGLGVALIVLLARGRRRRIVVGAACALAALDLRRHGLGLQPRDRQGAGRPARAAPGRRHARDRRPRGGRRRARAEHRLALGAARRARARAARDRALRADVGVPRRLGDGQHRGDRPGRSAHAEAARPVRRPRAAPAGRHDRAAAARARRLRRPRRHGGGAADRAARGLRRARLARERGPRRVDRPAREPQRRRLARRARDRGRRRAPGRDLRPRDPARGSPAAPTPP